MPYARISLLKGKSPEYLKMLSQSLHEALMDSFEVPANDLFQVIHQHEPEELIFDSNYLGGPRSQDYVLIAITAGRPRDTRTKALFYRSLVERLSRAPGVRAEDVMVVITTTAADEWSFGGGRAN